MPELPEVETTVRGLQKTITGKKVVGVWTDWPKLIKGLSLGSFRKKISGAKISGASRRGKHVIVHLSNGLSLVIHMKMTGHLLFGKYKKKGKTWVPAESGPLNDPWNRFIHFLISFSDGTHLAFSDTRKFGRISLEETRNLPHSPHLSHLGPEPLEKNFTFSIFKERIFKKKNSRIKPALMDQTLVVGIGNIYSDEALFRAGIHPEKRVGKLKEGDWVNLYKAVGLVLKSGIDFGGDSMSDYRNIYGKRGKFQEHHLAYQRKGEKCSKRGCSGIIVRKVVAGRSAHFCPRHQKIHPVK